MSSGYHTGQCTCRTLLSLHKVLLDSVGLEGTAHAKAQKPSVCSGNIDQSGLEILTSHSKR